MLKLRDGWNLVNTGGRISYIYPPPEIGTEYFVDMNSESIWAYPNGGRHRIRFDSIKEAHEYLIESGSESPWEES
jgi:hypothetical protein